MLDQISDPNIKLLDCTVPGFRITERSVAEMAKDIKEVASELPAKGTVIVMQLFDNSIYCTTDPGRKVRCSCQKKARTAPIMLKVL